VGLGPEKAISSNQPSWSDRDTGTKAANVQKVPGRQAAWQMMIPQSCTQAFCFLEVSSDAECGFRVNSTSEEPCDLNMCGS